MQLKEKTELKQARKVPELFQRCTWDVSAPFQREGTGEPAEWTCAMAPREGAGGWSVPHGRSRLSSVKEPCSLEKPPAGQLAATWRELPECSSSTGAEGLGHRGTSLLVALRTGDKSGCPTPHGPCLQLCPELARKPVLWYCLKLKLPAELVVLQECRAHDSLWHSAEAWQGETAALSVSSPARKHRDLCSTWGPAAISPAASPTAVHLVKFQKMICPTRKPAAPLPHQHRRHSECPPPPPGVPPPNPGEV